MPRRPVPVEPVPRRLRACSAIALIVFVAIVALITLRPGPPDPAGQSALRVFLEHAHQHGLPLWVTFGKIEFGANVLMFVPVGLFGALALRRHRWLIVPVATITSVGIEVTQAIALPLRDGTIRDVFSNTIGTLVGYLLATVVVGYLHRRTPPRALPARAGGRIPVGPPISATRPAR